MTVEQFLRWATTRPDGPRVTSGAVLLDLPDITLDLERVYG